MSWDLRRAVFIRRNFENHYLACLKSCAAAKLYENAYELSFSASFLYLLLLELISVFHDGNMSLYCVVIYLYLLAVKATEFIF